MNTLHETRCLLSDLADRLINLFKWPFAVIAVFFFPSSFLACCPSVFQLVRSSSLIPFLLGIATFWLVNKLMRKTSFWAWLGVLEHEIIHLLLGLACFKIPNRWRVTSQGGHVGFDRGGNWIITISPYVFPLIPFLTFVSIQSLAAFTPLKLWVLPACMGFSMAAHVAFTWLESHYRQPDIQRIGMLFSILVAPTLHCVFLALILVLTSSKNIPLATERFSDLFGEIRSNAFGAWNIFGQRGSQLVFEELLETGDRKIPPSQKIAPNDKSRTQSTSTPSGIRFERRRSN